ncbi:Transcription factor, fungi, partial [Metarhizium hybridum]
MTTRQDQSRSPSRPRRFYKRSTVACKACHGRKLRATPDSQQGNSTSPAHSHDHPENEADDISGRRYPPGLQANEAASNAAGMVSGFAPGPPRDDQMNGTRSPYYLGDERGPLALAINICRDDGLKSSRHALLPMNNSTPLTPQDWQYLEQRGCFSLPSRVMQDALLRAYFHYVHPFAPVIDVADFVYRYTTGHVSVLLLWSMFAAAGSFIDEQLPTNELGATRIEVKAAAFERAKALYDLEYERETIALIQSTYLMSYRLGCLNDVKGPWYWIGVAINLAYTAGLHRLPPPDSPDSPAGNSRLWIQLFWSVYCRDVWLCLAYSRPVRILLSEVTTPIPTRVQFASAPVEVPDDIYHRYLPYEINELARLWLCLVRISATLGSVLSSFYTAKSSGPTRQQIDYMEHEIEAHLADLPAGSHRSELVMIHVHQIRLYHEATTAILYIPQNHSLPYESPAKHTDSLHSLCLRKMRASALRITHLINVMIGEGLTTHVHMLTVIAMIPSMQVHLVDLMSSSQPTRQAGEHNLHLCMVLLDNLRTTHVSAKATHCLFNAAIEKIKNKPSSCPCPLLTGSGSASAGAAAAASSGPASASGSDNRSIVTDDDNESLFPVAVPGMSYLDMLPMMSPDGEFSLHE